MTPDQIQLVRHSHVRLARNADAAAELFYANLFEADPSLRPLFKGDIKAQGARLMEMIGKAVALLDKPHTLLPVLRTLGARHAGYGVQPAHYATVGGALLKTLEQGLGDAFDAPTRAAWTAMYDTVSRTMLEAADAAQALAA